jgi:hypothetical protein
LEPEEAGIEQFITAPTPCSTHLHLSRQAISPCSPFDSLMPLKRVNIFYRSTLAMRSNALAWSFGLPAGFTIPALNVRLYTDANSIALDDGIALVGPHRYYALGYGIFLDRTSQALLKVETLGSETLVRSIPNGPELTFAPAASGKTPILKRIKLAIVSPPSSTTNAVQISSLSPIRIPRPRSFPCSTRTRDCPLFS